MNLSFINQKNEEKIKADWKIDYIKFNENAFCSFAFRAKLINLFSFF